MAFDVLFLVFAAPFLLLGLACEVDWICFPLAFEDFAKINAVPEGGFQNDALSSKVAFDVLLELGERNDLSQSRVGSMMTYQDETRW